MSSPALVTAALLALAAPSIADACSCVEPSLTRSWHDSSDTFQVHILRDRVIGEFHYYEAEVVRPFSGCTQPGDRILLETRTNGAACGIELPLDTTWLLTASDRDSRSLVYGFTIGLCGFNKPWEAVTDKEKEYLSSRPIACQRTNTVTCADGTDPVACFADPCGDVGACGDEATCESNYCGGCTAEYYDATWNPVCTPW
jgi:hypothetical protein